MTQSFIFSIESIFLFSTIFSEEPDDTGYSKAEINNKIVLVPMKYLQLVDLDKLDRERVINERKAQLQQLSNTTDFSSSPSHNQTSPEPMNRTYPQLLPSSRDENVRPGRVSPSRSPVQSPPRTLQITPATNNRLQVPASMAAPVSPKSAAKQLRKPKAPSGLRVEVVANQKLYIEWGYVQHLDHETKSNGTTVTGFRVCYVKASSFILSKLHPSHMPLRKRLKHVCDSLVFPNLIFLTVTVLYE